MVLKAANLTLEGKITINFKVAAPGEGYVARFYYEKYDFDFVKEVPMTSANWHSDSTAARYMICPVRKTTMPIRNMSWPFFSC